MWNDHLGEYITENILSSGFLPYLVYTLFETSLATAGTSLLRFAVALAAIICDTWLVSVCAHVIQGSCITVNSVDTNNLPAVNSSCALDIDVALTLAIAVSARPVNFAIVFGIEVDDLEGKERLSLTDYVQGEGAVYSR